MKSIGMKHIIKYKSLELIKDEELKSIEFIANDQILESFQDYINSMTLIEEYADIERPDYILLNKLNTEFALTKDLFNYTKEVLFHQLGSWGVKKILIIVKEVYYEKIYKDIENLEPLMKGFKTQQEAYDWIMQNQNQIA
jgi:hypothetical protein